MPCPCGMLSGISQGKNSSCKCLSWLGACEPNTGTATETPMVELPSHGALQPMGVCCALQCFVFFLSASFLPLVKRFVLSFICFYYIAVVLTTVRSLYCKRICLSICVFVNYCDFPDKKEHQGASWQIRWQRETGGVQMRNTEHPERETRH